MSGEAPPPALPWGGGAAEAWEDRTAAFGLAHGTPLGCRASRWEGGKCRDSGLTEEMGTGRGLGASRVADVSPRGRLMGRRSTGSSGAATWVLTLGESVCFMAAEVALLHALCAGDVFFFLRWDSLIWEIFVCVCRDSLFWILSSS